MTGREIRPDERFAQALSSTRHAEEFGYDAVGAPRVRHGSARLGDHADLGEAAPPTTRQPTT
ncbi:hypothetical protein GCM10010435_26750 [Winogradskya consettensis]|uniref:Uncharacterized protein n=1 Tax=Winogradskya consettensis TaxID=113560 RepID=A0A919VLX0_9ACTN|nr:hypothetical protein Aco04nite_09540 [Actinoplanes consettensis]